VNIEGIGDHIIARWHPIELGTSDCPHVSVCSSGGWNDHPLISTDGVEPSICWWLVMSGRSPMPTNTWWIPKTP
jgi:hypothetical protein